MPRQTDDPKVGVGVSLSASVLRQIRIRAQDRGISTSAWIEEALREALDSR